MKSTGDRNGERGLRNNLTHQTMENKKIQRVENSISIAYTMFLYSSLCIDTSCRLSHRLRSNAYVILRSCCLCFSLFIKLNLRVTHRARVVFDVPAL